MRVRWNGGPGNIYSVDGLTLAPGAEAEIDDEAAALHLNNPLMSVAGEEYENPLVLGSTRKVGAAGLQPAPPVVSHSDIGATNMTVGASNPPSDEDESRRAEEAKTRNEEARRTETAVKPRTDTPGHDAAPRR